MIRSQLLLDLLRDAVVEEACLRAHFGTPEEGETLRPEQLVPLVRYALRRAGSRPTWWRVLWVAGHVRREMERVFASEY